MGWETRVTATLYFNRCSYTNRYQVENDLEETTALIKTVEDDLKNLAVMTEPKKFCEAEEDPFAWAITKAKQDIEDLHDLYIQKFKLDCTLEVWDQCHTKDGEPIHPPKEYSNEYGEVAFIDGDYIMTKQEEADYRKDVYGEEE